MVEIIEKIIGNMERRILFLARKVGDAPTNSLNNSGQYCVEYLKQIGIITKMVEVIDHSHIVDEVTKFQPTDVIIESTWVVPIEFFRYCNLFPYVNWYIRIHSDIGFLCTEMYGLEWIRSYQKLKEFGSPVQVVFNNQKFAENFSNLYQQEVIYLPNIYPTNFAYKDKQPDTDFINIGSFGALRHLKNRGFQAMCAMLFANKINKKLRYHINLAKSELTKNTVIISLRELFKNTEHELIEHSWMNREEFLSLVQSMDLGMQLSYTESFNFITCDFLSQSVPILISDVIEWGPEIYKSSTYNVEQVVSDIEKLYTDRYNRKKQYESYMYLKNYNSDAKEIWKKLFS